MNTEAIITSTVAIIGVFGTLLGFVIHQAVAFGKMQEKLEMNGKMDESEREKANEKFNEIFSRLNGAENSFTALSVKIDNMSQDIAEIKEILREERR